MNRMLSEPLMDITSHVYWRGRIKNHGAIGRECTRRTSWQLLILMACSGTCVLVGKVLCMTLEC